MKVAKNCDKNAIFMVHSETHFYQKDTENREKHIIFTKSKGSPECLGHMIFTKM